MIHDIRRDLFPKLWFFIIWRPSEWNYLSPKLKWKKMDWIFQWNKAFHKHIGGYNVMCAVYINMW